MAVYSHDYAACPWCEADSGCRVDHLYEAVPWSKFGPWTCHECRRQFTGVVNAPHDVTLSRYGADAPNTHPAMTLLRMDGKKGPVFFVIKMEHYDPAEPDAEWQCSARYLYEEHSCPTNWLRDCVAVIENDDCDPHGFLSFVRAVEVPEDFDEDDDTNWPLLFPEAFKAPVIDVHMAAAALLGPEMK